MLKHIKRRAQKVVFLVFACCVPFVVKSTTEEAISAKQVEVTMRKIGHEILNCLGDHDSRVLPIKKIGDQQYKISFATEIGFDPGEIIPIVDIIMMETRTATDYLVEVEHCLTKEIVHAEVRNTYDLDQIVCDGRVLPNDCYNILIAILARTRSSIYRTSPSLEQAALAQEEKSVLFKAAFIIVPLLLLVGFIGLYIKKRKPVGSDPNLLLIGASRFDKKNRVLLFENKSVELSNKEAELLTVLYAAANTAVERDVILQKVWGDEGDYVGRTLDVFISKLRKKLASDESVKIVNIRGVGYKLTLNRA